MAQSSFVELVFQKLAACIFDIYLNEIQSRSEHCFSMFQCCGGCVNLAVCVLLECDCIRKQHILARNVPDMGCDFYCSTSPIAHPASKITSIAHCQYLRSPLRLCSLVFVPCGVGVPLKSVLVRLWWCMVQITTVQSRHRQACRSKPQARPRILMCS